jgi:hypothetical protein
MATVEEIRLELERRTGLTAHERTLASALEDAGWSANQIRGLEYLAQRRLTLGLRFESPAIHEDGSAPFDAAAQGVGEDFVRMG